MKQSEMLKSELDKLNAEHSRMIEEIRANGGYGSAMSIKYESALNESFRRMHELESQIKVEERRELSVGDGCTYHLHSDSHACTVIKRTKKSITIQRDKATLDPNFKPHFEEGGFSAHCTNQDEQSYTYERDPHGEVLTAMWSEKRGAFICYGKMITVGRHEFYDYNF